VAIGQPHPYIAGHRDRRRTAAITRRNVAKPTSAPTRMHVPSGNAISIRSAPAGAVTLKSRPDDAAGARPAGFISATTCTGKNVGIGSGINWPH
jgi:hypothetical protein